MRRIVLVLVGLAVTAGIPRQSHPALRHRLCRPRRAGIGWLMMPIQARQAAPDVTVLPGHPFPRQELCEARSHGTSAIFRCGRALHHNYSPPDDWDSESQIGARRTYTAN